MKYFRSSVPVLLEIVVFRVAVLVKPEPRPEVDRLASELAGRERARRIVPGTGDMIDLFGICFYVIWER